jgi:uncharacterized protein YjbJ (UPF0337 family)
VGMRSRRAEKAAKESETLRVALVRQEYVLAAQTQQVATCNALHELEDRDLLKSGSLPLTQEFLAQMLGVQRSSVTLVARKLQEAGLISYRRGSIEVIDVEGLQDSCGECYGAINRHFSKLIGCTGASPSRPLTHQFDRNRPRRTAFPYIATNPRAWTMDKEHIKGAADKVKGSVKDTVGKVTGDTKMQAEGKLDKAKGSARDVAGDVKDAARDATDND